MYPRVSGIVLAGGKSSRLGFDKSLVPFGDQPLISRVVATLRPIVDECIVVTNHAEKFSGILDDVRFVSDAWAKPAALVGIYSGLLAAQNDYSLVVACDMPFLNPALLRRLISLAPGWDAVIPRHEKGTETLHAVYSRACVAPIERLLRKDEAVIVRFFSEVRVRYLDEPDIHALDPEKLSFININTPEDWEYAQALAWQKE